MTNKKIIFKEFLGVLVTEDIKTRIENILEVKGQSMSAFFREALWTHVCKIEKEIINQ